MTPLDPERRGSGIPAESQGLMASRMNELDVGTPSHDHHNDPMTDIWGRRAGAGPSDQGRFNQFSFPSSRTSSSSSQGRISMILHSKLFRNIAVLATTLIFLVSVLHTTKPEILGSGLQYMSNLPGLSRLAQQEIRTLDERLRDLMTRPVLEQWEMELTNRYQVGRSCLFLLFPGLPLTLISRSGSVPHVHILEVHSPAHPASSYLSTLLISFRMSYSRLSPLPPCTE